MHVLAVVVVAGVDVHTANAEELTKIVQHTGATCALYYREVVTHLVASPVAFSVSSIRLTDEADGEAPFSVYKTCDPLRVDRSFLLIAWLPSSRNAAKIVTAHPVEIGEYLRMLQVFQHLVGFL